MHILVVEDQKKTATLIATALHGEGFTVDQLHRGDEVLGACKAVRYAALVLDVMLPGLDGLSVVRDLRQAGNAIPILLLSARGEVNDRVAGLEVGADDYLAKPFALNELIARVRAIKRRGKEVHSKHYRVADLKLDVVTRKARRGERLIELTNREFLLLEFLMKFPDRVHSRKMILEKVWEYTFDPGTNLVDVYIRKLRDKIDMESKTKLLHCIRHEGYILKPGVIQE